MKTGNMIVPLLAAAGLAFTVVFVTVGEADWPVAQPIAPPAQAQAPRVVAGAGLVEASTRNINVGSEIAGVVSQLRVEVGDRVKAGDVLLTLDDRAYRAALHQREARLAVAEQTLARLRKLVRPEAREQAKSRVAELKTLAEEAARQEKRFRELLRTGAVAVEETDRRVTEAAAAMHRLQEAEQRLQELDKGGWVEDVKVAEAEIEAAKADIRQIKTDLERIVLRAPVAGEILQINIRQGEYINNFGNQPAPVVLGDTDVLHVRVDIDENDAWRLTPTATARASLRGNSQLGADLAFVRVEPFVIPKRSLTGASSERVDTRVLQVLYSFPRASLPVFVGQQMDVFIETEKQ